MLQPKSEDAAAREEFRILEESLECGTDFALISPIAEGEQVPGPS